MSVNEKLAEELHKPVIKKLKRKQFYARFKDNICAADAAEMRSLSSKNRKIKFLLFVIDVFLNMHGLNIKKVKQFLILYQNSK